MSRQYNNHQIKEQNKYKYRDPARNSTYTVKCCGLKYISRKLNVITVEEDLLSTCISSHELFAEP